MEGVLEQLPGLCYLVWIRLVAFQEKNLPSLSSDMGGPGQDEDEDDGSPDININQFHLGLDAYEGPL